MEKLGGYLIPAKSKYNELEDEDQNQFKRNLQAFIRCYDFVTQVTRIMDVDLYKQATFCKYLNKILPKKRGKLVYDIDDKIELEFYKQEKGSLSKIPLVEEIGELKPAT
jgi:type I restriction enzyme R subunit